MPGEEFEMRGHAKCRECVSVQRQRYTGEFGNMFRWVVFSSKRENSGGTWITVYQAKPWSSNCCNENNFYVLFDW
jgi:hypothetical protein